MALRHHPIRTIIWFRNDLRVFDNAVLSSALNRLKDLPPNHSSVSDFICVYCFDPRHFQQTPYQTPKTGIYRAKFLIESIQNLRKNLKGFGSNLLVSFEKPENLIPNLLSPEKINEIYCLGEATYEEINVEKKVEKAIESYKNIRSVLIKLYGGNSLFHPDDLPYSKTLHDFPNVFTKFREQVESSIPIRPILSELTHEDFCKSLPENSLPPSLSYSFLPTLQFLGFANQEIEEKIINQDTRSVMSFEGGEDSGKERINQWMFKDDHLKDYFNIRNGMMGEGYSTKISPWLALGCISPRWLYYEMKRYEKLRNIQNKSTYWLYFELMCREFFRYLCCKYDTNTFLPGGFLNKRISWKNSEQAVRRWKLGCTGRPLVDANIREMRASGWMSNRGRQNVASYLVHDLKIDWRIGADYFESLLLDYDVCSNYGNWNMAAGLGGGRVDRFNITKQSKTYDPEGDYIRHWIPELSRIPAPLIFEPWSLSKEEQERYSVKIGVDYPMPYDLFEGKDNYDESKCFYISNVKVSETFIIENQVISKQELNERIPKPHAKFDSQSDRVFSRVQHF